MRIASRIGRVVCAAAIGWACSRMPVMGGAAGSSRAGSPEVVKRNQVQDPPTFLFPATGVRVGGRAVLLAIDDASFPLKRNLCLYLSKPMVRREPVLTPSRDNPNSPDCLAAHFYGTVLFDGGKYRMWYYPCHIGRNPDWSPELKAQAERWRDSVIPGPLCYAESTDGIQWTKPSLGQLLFKGSRENNAFNLPSALTADACVIRDEDDPDPSRRYKLAFWTQYDPWNYPTMRLATSPDGLVWKATPKPPIEAFLEHASFYKHNGLYIVNSQTFLAGESGRNRGRQGAAWVSTNFDQWLPECAESFALPYVANQKRDEVHLGVGAASLGNVAVGLYCIWHNDPEFGKISGDLGLVVSSDGVAFHEPVKGFVYLSTADSPVTPVAGKNYPTVLCQANGIVNAGDETRIYHGRWRNASSGPDYYAEVALATLPRDRWGAIALEPERTEGSVWSAAVQVPSSGCDVLVNAEGAAGLRIEVADERFNPIPGFSGNDSGTVQGQEGFDMPVRWPARTLADCGGRTIRLRAHLKKAGAVGPRLYALYLSAKPPAREARLNAAQASSRPLPAQDTSSHRPTIRLTDLPIHTAGGPIMGLLAEPVGGDLAPDACLLLTFSRSRHEAIHEDIYSEPAKVFLAAGHRVLSFDLPYHGDRTEPGHTKEIDGLRDALLAGDDPFARFITDARAAITTCIERGLSRPGRVFVCGLSRAGYCVLRLAAEDSRVGGVAALAPVTDWRALREFAAVKERDDVAALSLVNYAAPLAGRPVYLAIGSHDDRVGTECCMQFAQRLAEENRRRAPGSSGLCLHVVDDSAGHSLDVRWRRAGAEFLLRTAADAPAAR